VFKIFTHPPSNLQFAPSKGRLRPDQHRLPSEVHLFCFSRKRASLFMLLSCSLLLVLSSCGGAVPHLGGTGTSSSSAAAALSGLSCSSASITGSGTDACTVTLTSAAPSSGLVVYVASNNSSVSLPGAVTVASGAVSAAFTVTSQWVTTPQAVTLTASAGRVSKSYALEVLADTQILTVTPTSLSFGNVQVNTTVTQSVTLASTGNLPVTVYAPSLWGTGFTISGLTFPLTLNAGQKATLSVHFDPASTGEASGDLSITSNNNWGNPTVVVSLNGTGATATTAELNSLSCNSASMTGSGTDACKVTLDAAAPTGGLTVSLASSNAAVKVPATVTVAAKATSAAFTATVSSVTTAQKVTLTASAGGISETFALQLNVGAATPTLSVNASSIAFGSVGLYEPATQSLTLTSSGSATVTISKATLTGAGFTMSGVTFPVTLNPGQVATLTVQFDPTTAGAVSGKLVLTSNSSTGSTTTISLTGTGTAPQVELSWTAPSSATDPIAGYNIYRSTGGSTSYQLLNSSVSTQTAYVDTTVQPKLTYDYVVRSVDDSGVESAPSNMTSVAVP
jgi:hypothetical protein